MHWVSLQDESQLNTIIEESYTTPVVLFKHSTRCSISVMAKTRIDNAPQLFSVKFYYLDLLKHRNLSNLIANQFHVHHESPQVLIIKNGECVYGESHNGITLRDLEEHLKN